MKYIMSTRTLDEVNLWVLFCSAIDFGQLGTLKLLYKKGVNLHGANVIRMVKEAIHSGFIHILMWWHKTGQLKPNDCRRNQCDILGTALQSGYPSVLKFMLHIGITVNDCRAHKEILFRAAYGGHTSSLEWLRQLGITIDEYKADPRILDHVLKYQKIEAIKWFSENGYTAAECVATLRYRFLQEIPLKENCTMIEWFFAVDKTVKTDYNLLLKFSQYNSTTLDIRELLNWVVPGFENVYWSFSRELVFANLILAVKSMQLMLYPGKKFAWTNEFDGFLNMAVHFGCVPVVQWLVNLGVKMRNPVLPEPLRVYVDRNLQLECAAIVGVPRKYFTEWRPGGDGFRWMAWRDLRLAVVILAGRRSRCRLPPELWEYLRAEF
jgi:hypothetical protein